MYRRGEKLFEEVPGATDAVVDYSGDEGREMIAAALEEVAGGEFMGDHSFYVRGRRPA